MTRAAIYARVSSDMQVDNYSVDAQLHACRTLCQSRGWEIAAEYVEQGKSAHVEAAKNRPQFKAMLAAADIRQFEVVVVHKLDRFSRHQRTTLDAFDRMAKHDVAFVSVTENIDYSTAPGRLFLTMLGGLAEFFSDNLATEVSKGKQQRKREGLYNAFLPFGYVRAPGPGKATAQIDERQAEGVRLAFRMASEGLTAWEIARALNAEGHRTHGPFGSNPWSRDSVLAMLRNRFYLGELPGNTPGVHPPILTSAEWEAARLMMARRNGPRHGVDCVKREAQKYSLTGICWCAKCGSRMNVRSSKGRAQLYCSRRRQKQDCDQPSLQVSEVELAVEGWLVDLADPDVEAAVAQVERELRAPDDAEVERKRLSDRLGRLKNLYLMGDIGEDEYRAQRDELQMALAGLPSRSQDVRLDVERTAMLMREAVTTWRLLAPADRNTLLVALVERIAIDDNRVEVVPRPDVARLVPSSNSRRRRVSSSTVAVVRTRPRAATSPEALDAYARTARELGISAAARLHRTSRQTVRRALAQV